MKHELCYLQTGNYCIESTRAMRHAEFEKLSILTGKNDPFTIHGLNVTRHTPSLILQGKNDYLPTIYVLRKSYKNLV